jgi:hypothetical protein
MDRRAINSNSLLATKQKTNFLPLMTLIQLVDADKPGSQKDWPRIDANEHDSTVSNY